MPHHSRPVVPAVLALAFVALAPSPSPAQLRVIISGGFRAVYADVLPDFERSTGVTVQTTSGASQGDGPQTIGAQLRRGVPADVVIMNRMGLAPLIAEGRIAPGTDVDLARTPLAVAVRTGAGKPDISTTASFKQTLLNAKRVTIDVSTTGLFVTGTLFPRLGIANEMAQKTRAGGAEALAAGDADLAVLPASELLSVHGIEVVGSVPDDAQFIALFAAAVVSGSTETEAAKRLIAHLAGEATTAVLSRKGMERPPRR
jgi:molybdate transport system substrate-binding protein